MSGDSSEKDCFPDSMLAEDLTLQAALEALLFVSPEPVPARELARLLQVDPGRVPVLVVQLNHALVQGHHALEVAEVGGGYVLRTRPEFARYVDRRREPVPTAHLSGPALETLAVIAYRQPITRGEIEAIRGVNCESAINTLLEHRLIREAGRKQSLGRPILYETTTEFLVAFNLRSLGDLPPLGGETA